MPPSNVVPLMKNYIKKNIFQISYNWVLIEADTTLSSSMLIHSEKMWSIHTWNDGLMPNKVLGKSKGRNGERITGGEKGGMLKLLVKIPQKPVACNIILQY